MSEKLASALLILKENNDRMDCEQEASQDLTEHEDISALLNVPISEGKVNGMDAFVMHDSGFCFAAVSANYVRPEQYLDEFEDFLLMDCTPRKFQKATVYVETKYFTGNLTVLVVDDPVVDLVFGNVENRGDSNQQMTLNKQAQGNEEDKTEYLRGESYDVGISLNIHNITKHELTDTEQENNDRMDCEQEASQDLTEHDDITHDVSCVTEKQENNTFNDGECNNARSSAAAVTRSQAIKEKMPKSPLIVPSPEMVDRDTFMEFQREDESLRKYWDMVGEAPKKVKGGKVGYIVKSGLLFRIFDPRRNRNARKQLLVPGKLTDKVLAVAHDGLLSGHCGIKRTLERVASNFYWPDMPNDVRRYCRSCDICQKTVPREMQGKAPLQRMPVMKEPFKRVAVDLVGPIVPCAEGGYRFILTVVDYATRYPEAEALKTIDTVSVAKALIGIFCRVGFPEEILTDQGTQFMSNVMKEVNRLLSIKQLRTTPWHPMCNGLVERFNATLKKIFKRLCAETPKQWNRYLPAVLFAYRTSIQESIGFSPFELVFGRKVRGPMEILKEYWAKEDQSDETKTIYQYVVDLRNRLEETCALAQEELIKAQETQKKLYDRTAQPTKLKVGEKVLLLLPTKANKLLLQWKGPYMVVEKLSKVNYKIQVGKKLKNYHVNMLQPYVQREDSDVSNGTYNENTESREAQMESEGDSTDTEEIETEQSDSDGDAEGDTEELSTSIVAASLVLKDGIGDEADTSEIIQVCPLKSTESWNNVRISQELPEYKKKEVIQLLKGYESILTTLPGQTELEKHSIRTTTSEPVREKAYPIPYTQREVMKKEVESMLSMGVIRRSRSAYAAPPVLVKKPDGSIRFCVNYKKLNAVTIFDGEPMPCPDDIYIQMRGKEYRSKIDLSKGYWQIPVEKDSIEKTAFVTPDGVYEFLKLPFGLKHSAASFNRLMRMVLGGLPGVGCFVDDVCIFTDTWKEHIELREEVFNRLIKAGLTIKPSKCVIGYGLVEFVGHKVGVNTIHPRDEKVKEVLEVARPRSKRDVKSFLAMAGYYSRFLPKFADITYPLTELTKQGNQFKWRKEEEQAFNTVRNCLSTEPVLQIVDFDKVMYLQTDASDIGLGGALVQKHDEMYHLVKIYQQKVEAG